MPSLTEIFSKKEREPNAMNAKVCETCYWYRRDDEVERFLTESERLRRELDAAIGEIPKECGTCKYFEYHDCNRFYGENPLTNGICISTCKTRGWEWRGPRKGAS